MLLHLPPFVSVRSWKVFIIPELFVGLAQEEDTPVSSVSCDAETKICYSGYTDPESNIYFGIALPKNPVDPYDAIIKITSPVEHYWTGFAWGGGMVWNPLTLAWKNGDSTTISARFA